MRLELLAYHPLMFQYSTHQKPAVHFHYLKGLLDAHTHPLYHQLMLAYIEQLGQTNSRR